MKMYRKNCIKCIYALSDKQVKVGGSHYDDWLVKYYQSVYAQIFEFELKIEK